MPSSPLMLGTLGLMAGVPALTVPVHRGLADTGHLLEGSAVLLVLLAVHARFVLGILTRKGVGWWLIAIQAWLTYLPWTFVGTAWIPVSALLSGALLLAAHQMRSFALALLSVACGPVFLATPSGALSDVGWAVTAPLLGLVEFALVSLAGQAHRLSATRSDVIHRAVVQERRRFTRDLHDLVGHRLTVLVLKAQLVQRLVHERDEKAEQELDETLALLRALASDVRAVAHGEQRSSLENELSSARALLESVGIRCQMRVSCRDLSREVGEALTHALREGVTNVLRHATARECAIQLLEQDRLVSLSIRNDGVLQPYHPKDGGQGLINLTERIAVLGGALETTTLRGGSFLFQIRIPRSN
ncbi:sensor histidine kinase [Nonomuraea sp. CA-218870]|uniref:sensor histidine kinase n=1 Tax=Nonomuraea sp. CA-218870 TaxID=3239998 RepID=UPI003D9162BC